jgi:SNF2 family DNA or RNA helicase
MTNRQLKPGALDTLLDYQHEALDWLTGRECGHLWLSAGAGKTRVGILWALQVPSKIVAVTKSGVRRQFSDEIQQVTDCKVQILEGEKPQPLEPNADFYIVGYDTLPAHVAALRRLPGFTLILDEIHKCKSHKRWDSRVNPSNPMGRPIFSLKENRAVAVMQLAYSAKCRLGMTATPIPDRLRDLWAQLDLIEPKQHGGYWDWVKRYCDAKEGEFGGMDTRGVGSDEALAELESRLNRITFEVPVSRIRRELPPKRRSIYRVPECEQVRALGSMTKEIKAAVKQGESSYFELKLFEAASRKRKALLGRIEDAIELAKKIVVFTGRRVDCRQLGETLLKQCAQTWIISGEDSESTRYDAVKAYMAAPGPAVLVSTIGVGAESINLQDTDVAFVAMLPWRPADVIQLEGRFTRVGQTRPVEIVYLIAENSIDEHVAGILIVKLPIVDQVVGSDSLDSLAQGLRGGSDDEIMQQMLKRMGVTPSQPL